MDAIVMTVTAIMIIEIYDIDNNEEDDGCYHLCPYENGSHGGGLGTGWVTTS